MLEKDYGWEKTLQASDDTLITRPFCARMCHALQLIIMAICATYGEGSVHCQIVSGGSCDDGFVGMK